MPSTAPSQDPVAPYLVHGVFWDGPPATGTAADGGTPVLRLQSPEGDFRNVGLAPGSSLGFRVAAPGRFCLGHQVVHSAGSRTHVRCAKASPATKGKQCRQCFMLDDSRLIHDFHRGGRVPPGLRSYLMQEHWLYVATFAGGATKVGTASGPRKWNRLAEQGAVAARYVAHTADGRAVRVLEDQVTADLALTQQIRSAAKTDALLQPLAARDIDAVNARRAGEVRTLLARAAVEPYTPVAEQWIRPAQAAPLYAATPRHAYPHPLDGGGHGFRLAGLSGTNALAHLAGSDAAFVVNLGRLAARTVVLGSFASEVPAIQEQLF